MTNEHAANVLRSLRDEVGVSVADRQEAITRALLWYQTRAEKGIT